MIYYLSGLPYSDELYHHGIKGQKWYVRRFQNPDGTLTTLGKARYHVGNAAKKVGETAAGFGKKLATHEIDKIKSKHTWMMTDEEIANKTDRIRRENALKEEFRRNKNESRGKKLVANILEDGAKTVSSKMFNRIASELFDKKDPAVRDYADVLTDPNATEKEIKAAKDKYENKVKYNGQKAYNAFLDRVSNEVLSGMNNEDGSFARIEDLERANEYAQVLREISGITKKEKKNGGNNNATNQGGRSMSEDDVRQIIEEMLEDRD